MTRTVLVQPFLQKQRSKNTQIAYEHGINRFLAFVKIDQQIILQKPAEELDDLLEDFLEHLTAQGLAGKTIHVWFHGVKSWLRANKKNVTTICKDLDYSKIELDYIPYQSDVKLLLEKARLDYQVGISLTCFAGMRPIDARRLTYAAIKQSYERGDTVLTIVFKEKKRKNWYFTFLASQGTVYVRKLIEKRKQQGESITDDSYVFSKNGLQVVETAYRTYMRRLIRRTVGDRPTNEPFRRFRTYGLRKYFKQWSRKLGNDVSEFLMGHKIGMQTLSAIYSGLADLDPKIIDEIKALYIEHMPSLETEITDLSIKSELDDLKEKLHTYEAENQELRQHVNHQKERVAELKAQQLTTEDSEDVAILKNGFEELSKELQRLRNIVKTLEAQK